MARKIELEVALNGINKVNTDLVKLEKNLEAMKEQLKGVQQGTPEFDKLSQSIKNTETEMAKLSKSAQTAYQEIGNLSDATGEASQEQMTLNAQIGEAEDKLMLMAQAGDTSSKAYKDLVQEVGKMKKVQMDTNIQIDRAAQGFTGKLTTGVQRVAAAYQVGMAATQMFGVESEKAQAVMAKLQAVMAFTQGVEQLKQLTVGMKLFGTTGKTALSGIQKAIIATGIGALVVAVGLLLAYWEDIANVIGDVVGASSEELRVAEKNVETSKKKVDLANEELEAFGLQENALRLQGKSEKEILELRLGKIDALIKEQEIYIANIKQKQALELELAQQNQETLKMVIRVGLEMSAFGIRMLAAPIDVLIETANSVAELLGFNAIVSKNLNEMISEGLEAASDYGASFFIDIDAKKAENEKLVKEEQKKLEKLKSDRDGLKLQIQQIEQQEVENSIKNAEERAAKLKELREQELEIIKSIYERDQAAFKENEKAKIDALEDDLEKQKALLELAYGDERAAMIDKAIEGEIKALDERFATSKMTEEEYFKELQKLRLEGYDKLTDNEKALLTQKEETKNKEIEKLDADAKDKLEKRQKDYLDYKNSLITDADEKAKLEAEKAYNEEKDKLDEFLKDKVITQEDYNQLLIDAEQRKNDEIDRINTEARNKEKMKVSKFFSDMVGILDSVKGEGTELMGSILSSVSGSIGSFIELTTQEFDNVAEKVSAYAQVIGGLINSILGAVSEEQKARTEESLANVEATYDKEAEALQKNKDNGIITEEQFNKQKYALDLKRYNQEEAIKKKAFESEKAMKIASAIVSGLQGAVAAFASAMTIPPPAGPILGGILAGIVGSMTALNVAKIASTKYEAGTPPSAPGGGAGDIGGAVTSAMESPTPSATTLFGAPMTGGNQGGQEQGLGMRQQPMRAYVLESDITTSQNTISTYEQRAEIG